jgi:glycosyltransferase involved in cell wall biosynthesis
MRRVGLICSEPLRERMAGIGVRYVELARRLPRADLDVVLVTTGDPGDVPSVPLERENIRRFRPGRLAQVLAGCDAVVAQGELADHVLRELPALPTVIDLYDPWLVENLHYAGTLGHHVYERDFASWMLQLTSGDFFLCSSEEQRAYYLGFLTAIGRMNPQTFGDDRSLSRLIAAVPFGVPEELPAGRPLLPARRPDEKRILFGGIYDWLDPWPVLRALERAEQPDWTLMFVRNPNPETTPQETWRRVEEWCRQRGWWGNRVLAIDWVRADRRFDLFRDVDALVVCHEHTLETQLSFRTRTLEALAAGCPVVATEGGGVSALLAHYGAGRVVPAGDAAAIAAALADIFDRPDPIVAAGARRLLQRFTWERVLEPLVEFCLAPRSDPFKRPVPSGGLSTRSALRGYLRRLTGGRPIRSAVTRAVDGFTDPPPAHAADVDGVDAVRR